MLRARVSLVVPHRTLPLFVTPLPRTGARQTWVLLASTALLLVGCGGRTPGAVAPAPVGVGAQGYAHQLVQNGDTLCEQRAGQLRCRGFHPLNDELDEPEDAWMSYGDGFSRLGLGGFGVCGLRAGRVLCWGVDVGDEEPQHESVAERTCSPQTFADLVGLRELAMTEDGGCAITADRVARCWGLPLGLEDPDDMGLYDVARGARGLAVGPYMGCAITERGLRCWGSVEGLGDELDFPPTGRSVSVPVPDPAQVVVGDGFACARTEGLEVWCWGWDQEGQLGRREVSAEPQPPTRIPGLAAVDLVASNTSVCARGPDGRTFCWGLNNAGQLGLGHTRRVDAPMHVPALDGALDVALSDGTVCARMSDGGVYCAGYVGPLLLDERMSRVAPTRLPGPAASHVALNASEVCVATEQGNRCFGGGGLQWRGHQEAAAGWALSVADESPVSEVASASRPHCVRFRDGRVHCENGTQPPITFEGTHAFASHGPTACVVDHAHNVQCWSRLEAATPPARVAGVVGAAALDLTSRRGCALLTNGGLQCWVLRPDSSGRPAGPTTDLRDLRAVALALERTCVLRQGGQVTCWNQAAPLTGTLEGVSQLAPFESGFLVVVAGVVHEVRIQANELSLGAAVPGVSGVVELAAAGRAACARNEAGEVRCWGQNDFSQFGVLSRAVSLGLTPLVEREVPPEPPAMLECGPAPRPDDEYDEYDEYEDYY